MRTVQLLLSCLFIIILISCREGSSPSAEVDWSYADAYYKEQIALSMHYLLELSKAGADAPNSKSLFKNARAAFKKAEPYASYLNPEVGHRVNGPALPVFKEDNEKILPPIGFQKIEESIYDGGTDPEIFITEVELTIGLLEILKKKIEKRELDANRFFISTQQQLLRIISLGISGFDSPVSFLGLEESRISLESLWELYDHSFRWIIKQQNPLLDDQFRSLLDGAINFIDSQEDFESFDRFTFIRDHMNPITRSWVAIRKESGLWQGTQTQAINLEAPTFFENNSFNSSYFLPMSINRELPGQVDLGKKLFYEPRLSANGSMACATCHMPEKAFADGMIANLANTGAPLERNTPTLINSVYQQSFFWDGRSETLTDQISSVFTNVEEFNAQTHAISEDILTDSIYIGLFEQVYGRSPRRNNELIQAIGAYIGTLNSFNSKFDRNIRAEEDTFTEEEVAGFNLFMGKALCASCHFIPLTNGTVPPFYDQTEKEVIGVPGTPENLFVDADNGFYWKFKSPLHKGMFKTPTVRNVAETAPYMHNGVYNTLEEVVDFYNRGGGVGFGFDLEHQTLPSDKLELTESEQQALVKFMQTLSDTNIKAH